MKIFKQNNLFGLKNDDDVVIIPPKFYKSFVKSIKDLSLQELFKIKLIDIQYKLRPDGTYSFKGKNDKRGLKKYNGDIILECKYDYIYEFQKNGLFRVLLNFKYGLMNKKGKLILKCNFDWIGNFESDGIAVVRVDEKYGLVNTKGEIVVECKYDFIHSFSPKYHVPFELDGRYGVKTKNGKIVTNNMYDRLYKSHLLGKITNNNSLQKGVRRLNR